MKLDQLPINWFDFLLLIAVIIGLVRGKKRGFSEELLDVFKWLIIVVVGGMVYKPIGKLASDYALIPLFWGYVSIYLIVMIAVSLTFEAIKRMVGEKLVRSDAFGKLEFSLGMLAGAVRYFCMLLVPLAIIHAKYYTPAEQALVLRTKKENPAAVSFFNLASLQQTIFIDSISGRFIEKHFSDQLIEPAMPGPPPAPRKGLGGKIEKAINDGLKPSKK